MRADPRPARSCDVPVALLAGGMATRLRPITHKVPKCMVDVAGRPFIDHQLDLLRENGIHRVVLCLGYLGEQVVAHVGDGSSLGMEIRYSFDGDKLLGTGGAIRRALPLLGDTFWILYGDSYLDFDFQAAFEAFASRDALGLMTVLHNDNRWDQSNVVFEDGKLLRYDKKLRLPAMAHIDYGASILRASAASSLPVDRPSDLSELFTRLVAEGSMIGFEVAQRFYEIGSPRGLVETAAYLMLRRHGQAWQAA